jgi:hypothetical protein
MSHQEQLGVRRDAAYLTEHRFRCTSRLEKTWTPEATKQFMAGLAALHTGVEQMPTGYMDPARYLSHHVMQLSYSKEAGERKLMQLYRSDKVGQAAAAPLLSASDQSENVSPDVPAPLVSDSEDEAEFL